MNALRENPAKNRVLRNMHSFMTIAVILLGTLYVIFFAFFPTPLTLGKALGEFGYHEVIPPSNLFGPGTFNSVEDIGNQSVKLHPTCNIEPHVLERLWKEYPTVDKLMQAQLSREFDVSSKFTKNLESVISGKQIKVAHLSLQNVRIVLLTQENLLKLRDRYLKGTCEQAIIHNTKNGACVRQSQEVLKADLVYTVSFEENANMKQHVSSGMQKSKHTLGLERASDAENIVSGKQLFYGVKLSPKCLLLNDSMFVLNES